MEEQTKQQKPVQMKRLLTPNLFVPLAGVIVALVLGIGQWRLQNIGARTTQNQALASLSIALGDDKDQVRRLAARGLARFGKVAIPTLLMSLEDNNEEVRSAAVDTIIKIYDLHEREQGFVIEQVKDTLKETGDNDAIEASVLILLYTNPDNLIPTLKGLRSESINTAINGLKRGRHLEHLKELFKFENLSVVNRLSIISAVGEIPAEDGEPDVKYLIGIGKDNPNVTIRANTISTLGILMNRISESSNSVSLIKSALLEALDDKEFRVRMMAVSALEKFCSQTEVQKKLMELSERESSLLVSNKLLRVLGECKN